MGSKGTRKTSRRSRTTCDCMNHRKHKQAENAKKSRKQTYDPYANDPLESFCPYCGVKFTSEFRKRNKRYRADVRKTPEDVYKTNSEGLYIYSATPRLVIEDCRYFVTSSSKFFYTREKDYKVESRWHSGVHGSIDGGSPTAIGPYGTRVSMFSWMFYRYMTEEKNQNRTSDGIRLVLVNGHTRKIIREHHRYIDHAAMIEEAKRQDKMPVCSGMGLSG